MWKKGERENREKKSSSSIEEERNHKIMLYLSFYTRTVILFLLSSFSLSHYMALLHLPFKYKSILLLLLCLPHIKILYTQRAPKKRKKNKIFYAEGDALRFYHHRFHFVPPFTIHFFPSSYLCASFFLIIECECVFGKIDFSLIISSFFIITSDSLSPR